MMTAMKVQPGDSILLAADAPMTRQEADEFMARLRERIPGVNFVLMTGCGVMRGEEVQPWEDEEWSEPTSTTPSPAGGATTTGSADSSES